MSKYAPLGEFLRAQPTQEVPMSFSDIERVTGVKLPPKAQHHRAWWSNNPSNSVLTKVWLAAGFETERVDMAGRRLVFRRKAAAAVPGVKAIPPPAAAPGSIGQHPLFGAMKGLMHIPAGVDLTLPADPDWGNMLDQNGPKGGRPG
jgi:hypothetical protein